MSWTSLQMISLGSLLLFGDRPLCAGSSRCVTEDKFSRLLRRFQEELVVDGAAPGFSVQPPDVNKRSLSPWEYRKDTNDSRHPREIFIAKCEHHGCMIGGEESNNYNSVEVVVPMLVVYKSKCKNGTKLTHTRIMVPVACTCVQPKS